MCEDARGAILGITRDTGADEVVTAGLQSVCYQTVELVDAMFGDCLSNEVFVEEGSLNSTSSISTPDLARSTVLRVDGGMVTNNWLIQFLADIMDAEVDRPLVTETTALGISFLVGLQAGIHDSLEDIAKLWQCERRFVPAMDEAQRKKQVNGWKQAVNRTLS